MCCCIRSSYAQSAQQATEQVTKQATQERSLSATAESGVSDNRDDNLDVDRLDPDKVAFFEQHIRPLFIAKCLECHSSDTEASGGLLLDSRPNWERGGDTGEAIVPQDPSTSLLMRAVLYDDPDLQMPPDGKLPDASIAALNTWIEQGAVDPRNQVSVKPSSSRALAVANAHEHWAYRPWGRPELPIGQPTESIIDRFINAKLASAGVEAVPLISRRQWLRRMYFDLHGLPPDPRILEEFEADAAPDAEARMVDQLLQSPRFGETFARRWMDVARFAESVTLRGFVLPEAWRYRDYLIDAFNEDRPFDQMIIEQVAGDLLSAEDNKERTRQLVATSFLTLGNTNLEEQDKTQLEMDYIDEQLEVLGRAFLAQTIGCARCHDHKFDPIPTRDYYALAGIFRNTVAMEHENVSKWVEEPLPIEPEQAAFFDQLAVQSKELTQKIASLKKKIGAGVDPNKAVDIATLEGVVIDDVDAKLVGDWVDGMGVSGFVSEGYRHDGNNGKGQKSATFEPKRLPPGQYRVRMSYTPAANRATNVKVVVFSADGEKTHRINQQQAPDEGVWITLGTYRFEKDGQGFVIVSNSDADGHVVIDAVQFIPTEAEKAAKITAEKSAERKTKSAVDDQELKNLEKELAALKSKLESRPRFMTVREQSPAKDIPIHIRGNVHALGEIVPRGFLSAVDLGEGFQSSIDERSSGRLPLARWLSDSRNPLTARVYANRVWAWLMGQGLVATTNNFGTTGASPSHEELLDWLASELVRSGWSTKHLVRCIVLSNAYRRSVADASSDGQKADPNNQLLWRGNLKRVTVESLRDAMLSVSGELDSAVGGPMIKRGVKEDYNYPHQSTRRSLYHPVLRNALPELFEEFDFADTSVSIGERARSTVAPQALLMMNHPWVIARSQATAKWIQREFSSAELAVEHLHRRCFGRSATQEELAASVAYLIESDGPRKSELDVDRLAALVQSLFASLDFRYLE